MECSWRRGGEGVSPGFELGMGGTSVPPVKFGVAPNFVRDLIAAVRRTLVMPVRLTVFGATPETTSRMPVPPPEWPLTSRFVTNDSCVPEIRAKHRPGTVGQDAGSLQGFEMGVVVAEKNVAVGRDGG